MEPVALRSLIEAGLHKTIVLKNGNETMHALVACQFFEQCVMYNTASLFVVFADKTYFRENGGQQIMQRHYKFDALATNDCAF